MPKKHSITLYEVENKGRYHEHWLASSPLDAARRAISHAQECGLKLDRVDVSSMVQPEDARKGGLVYVANDTRIYAVDRGRVRRADPPGSDNRASKRTVPSNPPSVQEVALVRATTGGNHNPNRKDESHVSRHTEQEHYPLLS